MTVLSNIITPSNVLTTTNTATVTNKTLTSPILTTPTLGVATATSLQGIIGNVTPAAGSFTTVTASTAIGTASGGTGLGGATPFTANGVVFASSASALSTGSSLTFNGTSLSIGVSPSSPVSKLNVSVGNVSTLGAPASMGLSIDSNDNNIVVGNLSQIGLGLRNDFQPSYIAHVVTSAAGYSNGSLVFGTRSVTTDTAPSERLRITSAGDVGIGTTSPQGKTESKTATVAPASPAYGQKAFVANIGYSTANITSSLLAAYDTNIHGADIGYAYNNTGYDLMFATNNTTSGSPTERARITSAGGLLVAKTTNDIAVAGFQTDQSGQTDVTVNGSECMNINRNTNDGDLVRFRQDNNVEGSISVSGTTVSYNGGHLSRWAQTTTAKDNSIVKGTVLSNLDEMNVYTKDGQPVDNEQLNKVKVSDTEGDVNVAGVFVNWTFDDQHNVDEINMAMTGDMIIRIAQGVTVVRGDLLMSAGDGTAKPQGDDIVRSKTVAKVTSNHVTCTYADGSYCVPCVLMAC